MSPLAFVLVLAAAVVHAAWNIVAHGVSRAGSVFLWWGAVASTVIWGAAIPLTGGFGPDGMTGFLLGAVVSAAIHIVYMFVLQHGYRVGNLSTVYATARGSGPLLSVIVAILLLGERPSPLALVGVAAVIAGVVAIGLIDRPPVETRRGGMDPAVVFGLLTGVTIAAYTVWDAHAMRTWDLSPVGFMVGQCALQIPVYTVLVWRRRRELLPFFAAQWRRTLAFGVLSPLSYILVLTAVTMAPVALVAPMREVSVVLVSLFGALVLREGRPVRRVAASAVVAVGIALLAL